MALSARKCEKLPVYWRGLKEGMLSLPEGDAETMRCRECQGYLDRD